MSGGAVAYCSGCKPWWAAWCYDFANRICRPSHRASAADHRRKIWFGRRECPRTDRPIGQPSGRPCVAYSRDWPTTYMYAEPPTPPPPPPRFKQSPRSTRIGNNMEVTHDTTRRSHAIKNRTSHRSDDYPLYPISFFLLFSFSPLAFFSSSAIFSPLLSSSSLSFRYHLLYSALCPSISSSSLPSSPLILDSLAFSPPLLYANLSFPLLSLHSPLCSYPSFPFPLLGSHSVPGIYSNFRLTVLLSRSLLCFFLLLPSLLPYGTALICSCLQSPLIFCFVLLNSHLSVFLSSSSLSSEFPMLFLAQLLRE